jgi:hypothetical protein
MERMYSSYSFTTSAGDEGEWSASLPGRALPPGCHPLNTRTRKMPAYLYSPVTSHAIIRLKTSDSGCKQLCRRNNTWCNQLLRLLAAVARNAKRAYDNNFASARRKLSLHAWHHSLQAWNLTWIQSSLTHYAKIMCTGKERLSADGTSFIFLQRFSQNLKPKAWSYHGLLFLHRRVMPHEVYLLIF